MSSLNKMAKNIEIILHDGGAIADFDGKEINMGNPINFIINNNRDKKYKLSSGQGILLNVIYEDDIPQNIERELSLLSKYIGTQGNITTSAPLYKPNKRNFYRVELPANTVLTLSNK